MQGQQEGFQGPTAIVKYVRENFGVLANTIESEAFRKGLINLSIDDFHVRLQQSHHEFFQKLSRTIPNVTSAFVDVLSRMLSFNFGEESQQISVDLSNRISQEALFYCIADRSFALRQVRGMRRPACASFNSADRRHHACVDFIHGRCNRGSNCRFSHSIQRERNFPSDSMSSTSQHFSQSDSSQPQSEHSVQVAEEHNVPPNAPPPPPQCLLFRKMTLATASHNVKVSDEVPAVSEKLANNAILHTTKVLAPDLIPTPPVGRTLVHQTDRSKDMRAIIWLQSRKHVDFEEIQAAVSDMGRFFACGMVDFSDLFNWSYFKLSTYNRELQARRFLICPSGEQVSIVDRTLFAAGRKDDGSAPQLPDSVRSRVNGNQVPSHRNEYPQRETTTCKYFSKGNYKKGAMCSFVHSLSNVHYHGL